MEFLFEQNYAGMSIFELGAMGCVLLQVWLYGRLSLWGPVMGVLGTIMWITLGARVEPMMTGLIVLNFILMAQNVWNFIKWSKNKKLAAAADAQEHVVDAA